MLMDCTVTYFSPEVFFTPWTVGMHGVDQPTHRCSLTNHPLKHCQQIIPPEPSSFDAATLWFLGGQTETLLSCCKSTKDWGASMTSACPWCRMGNSFPWNSPMTLFRLKIASFLQGLFAKMCYLTYRYFLCCRSRRLSFSEQGWTEVHFYLKKLSAASARRYYASGFSFQSPSRSSACFAETSVWHTLALYLCMSSCWCCFRTPCFQETSLAVAALDFTVQCKTHQAWMGFGSSKSA